MIPAEYSAAVARGLREAFGTAEFEGITLLTKGRTSSLVFRIMVQGVAYLLKIITRKGDSSRHFSCMQAAADAGIAPHVWYADAADHVFITDFVEEKPFARGAALVAMPILLRALHGLPAFPEPPDFLNTTCSFLLNKGPAVEGYLQKVQEWKLFPRAEEEEMLARYAELAAAYPWRRATDMVPSHNDLFKPDNILFDGNRVWLADWEAAFQNDRYADLAVVANMLVATAAEEQAYLTDYFGEPPTEYQLNRLFLAQQLTHLFYATGFLFAASAGQPVEWNGTLPAWEEYQRQFWSGKVSLTNEENKVAYARVHWERLKENTRLPRYQEALRVGRAS